MSGPVSQMQLDQPIYAANRHSTALKHMESSTHQQECDLALITLRRVTY